MRRGYCIVALVVVGAGLVPQFVHAADGLSVDPAVVRLTMQPGEIWRGQVAVTNTTGGSLTLRISPANLSRETNSDTIELAEDITTRMGTLAAWVRPSIESLTLASGERRDVAFIIQVPKNAPPGAHRGIIALAPMPVSAQSNALAVTAAVAVGIDLTVVGQPNHHIALRDVSVGPRIGTKPPVTILATLVNTGNTLPAMTVRAIIGRPWSAGSEVVMSPENGSEKIAPGSQTLFRGAWDGVGSIPTGLFKVRIIARDSSGTYEATRYFILVPWQVIVGIIVAIAVLMLARRFGPRAIRARRRRR